MKFSPESSVTQVPLLQSIRSQIDGGGRVISQNSPVNPEKHSHLNISSGMSVKLSPESSVTQVPLLQLIRSQIDGGGRVISQNSPVNPTKHWQAKFSPEGSVTQIPLLQSIRSQILGGGLGEGVGLRLRIKLDDAIGMSQNIPVKPGKHSHMTRSSPRSMHSPFVQLTNSHKEILGLGVGEIVTEMGVVMGGV